MYIRRFSWVPIFVYACYVNIGYQGFPHQVKSTQSILDSCQFSRLLISKTLMLSDCLRFSMGSPMEDRHNREFYGSNVRGGRLRLKRTFLTI